MKSVPKASLREKMRQRRNMLVEKNANIQQVLAQSVLILMIKQMLFNTFKNKLLNPHTTK